VFRLTAETEYGYHALIELAAAHGVRSTITLSDIVGDSGMSEKFMLHTLTQLRRAGLVESKRGKHGGYSLACPAERITMADLLRATRAIEAIQPNPDGRFLTRWWNDIVRDLETSARKTTLGSALTAERTPHEPMYYI
jgi:Rrf2 family protein